MMLAERLRRLPIAARMLLSALVLVVLVLPAAGALLSWNFREAVNTAFNERLESLLNVVIAGVSYDVRQNALVTNRQLGDSRFDRVFSGWYWQVSDEGERVLTSRSLWDQRLAVSRESGMTFRTVTGPRDKQLRV
ncbi:MAG: sensor histidine kinase, partial [Marinobacter sp.]